MASKMSGATAALGAMAAKASRAGRTLTRNVTLPMAALGAVGLKTAMDYERSMNILQQASGATGEQMGQFSRLAMALGADIALPGTSAADATAAMVELSKAGLSVADTMGAARGVLQLSAAGGLDNATAASVAANALNAFKLRGTEATRVADLLAGAANGSSAEVSELADSLSQGASVFAQAGIPIEDFVTSAALLANVGIKGSDAGTSLKSMLLKLQSPSKVASNWMETLGISIYDAQGRMKPFASIIANFTKTMGGMTQQARDQALGDIFGSDAIRAANAVLLTGVPAFNEMKKVTTEQGAAADAAAARNKGLAGALDGLKSSMETLALRVLVPALPVLTKMVTAFANFLPKVTSLPKPLLIAAGAFAGLVAAFGPLGMLLGAALSGPAVAAAAAITALGVAVYAAMNPEKAGAVVNQIKEKWNELSPGMFAALGRLWGTVSTWLATNGPVIATQVWEWAKAFFGWVAKVVPPLLVELAHLLGAIGTWMLDTAVPWLSDKLRTTWIPAFIGWVDEMGPQLIEKLNAFLKTLTTWIITDAAPKIVAAMAGLAGDVAMGLANSLPRGVVQALGNLPGGGLFKALGDAMPNGTNTGDRTMSGGAAKIAGSAFGGGVAPSKPMGPRPVPMARGGLLLGLNRPTPILAGEGRGKEDVLAVPHSKGGIGGLGGVTQNVTINGSEMPTEAALIYANRDLAWRMARVSGRR